MQTLDLTGLRFGRLTATSRAPSPGKVKFWNCTCDCGVEIVTRLGHLRSGASQSCGCLAREQTAAGRRFGREATYPEVRDGEEWRPVPGASLYQVSSHGRMTGQAGQIMGLGLDRNGYHIATITRDDGVSDNVWVHALVAAAFHGPCPTGKEVDHEDRTRTNNAPGNLRYLTHAANIANSDTAHGERHGGSKLTEALVREILAIPPAPRYGRRGKGIHPNSVTAIAQRYGLGVVTVHQIRRGERWRRVYEDFHAQPPRPSR
jgi:HNH endonuclease